MSSKTMRAERLHEVEAKFQVGKAAMPEVRPTDVLAKAKSAGTVLDSFSALRRGRRAINMQILPGLAERFEIEIPGIHTTDNVDYAMLLEGKLCLELDDGVSKALKVHDLVVQNGTRHVWRKKSGRGATMPFVLFGAKRIG